MQYILLIYGNAAPDELSEEALPQWMAFNAELERRNAHCYSQPLDRVETARTQRLRGGERIVTDGPYADTKEQLAGFYVIDCSGMDEALDLAAMIPTAGWSAIEVRPVLPLR